MRAVYLKEISKSDEEIRIKDSPFHHLKNVCRVKLGDDVLLINGNGLRAFSEVLEINKRDIKLSLKKESKINLKKKKHLCVW